MLGSALILRVNSERESATCAVVTCIDERACNQGINEPEDQLLQRKEMITLERKEKQRNEAETGIEPVVH